MSLLTAFTRVGGQHAVLAGTCVECQEDDGDCVETSTPLASRTACASTLPASWPAWRRKVGAEFAWGRIFHLYGRAEPPARLVASVILSLLRGEKARGACGARSVGDQDIIFPSVLQTRLAGGASNFSRKLRNPNEQM